MGNRHHAERTFLLPSILPEQSLDSYMIQLDEATGIFHVAARHHFISFKELLNLRDAKAQSKAAYFAEFSNGIINAIPRRRKLDPQSQPHAIYQANSYIEKEQHTYDTNNAQAKPSNSDKSLTCLPDTRHVENSKHQNEPLKEVLTNLPSKDSIENVKPVVPCIETPITSEFASSNDTDGEDSNSPPHTPSSSISDSEIAKSDNISGNDVSRSDSSESDLSSDEFEEQPIHHINFLGLPVYERSYTPPEVSFWAAATTRAKVLLNNEKLPETHYARVLASQAFKWIDPTQYIGNDKKALWRLKGSEMRNAATSSVAVVYREVGLWNQDHIGEDDTIPDTAPYNNKYEFASSKAYKEELLPYPIMCDMSEDSHDAFEFYHTKLRDYNSKRPCLLKHELGASLANTAAVLEEKLEIKKPLNKTAAVLETLVEEDEFTEEDENVSEAECDNAHEPMTYVHSVSHSEPAADDPALNTPVEVEEYNPLSMGQEGLDKIARLRARYFAQPRTWNYASSDSDDASEAEDYESDSQSEPAADDTTLNVVIPPVEVDEYNPFSASQEEARARHLRRTLLSQLDTSEDEVSVTESESTHTSPPPVHEGPFLGLPLAIAAGLVVYKIGTWAFSRKS